MWLDLVTGATRAYSTRRLSYRTSLRIDVDPPQFIDAGGEAITQAPAHFTIAPEALRIMVARDFAEPWG
jgi:diacylglycerol kinase family enzyme